MKIKLTSDVIIVTVIVAAAFTALVILFNIRDPAQVPASAERNMALQNRPKPVRVLAQPSELEMSYLNKEVDHEIK